jgi:hypothetical protein
MTDSSPSDPVQAVTLKRFLLLKRGLYYAPDNCGYTGVKAKAGRYLEADASPEHGITAVHEDDAADFAPACWPETKIATLETTIAHLSERAEGMREALQKIARRTSITFGVGCMGGEEAASIASDALTAYEQSRLQPEQPK